MSKIGYFVLWITIITRFSRITSQTQECSTNCSAIATAADGSNTSVVLCSMSIHMSCRNKNSTEPVVRPREVSSSWYFYYGDDSTQRIALNFSWSPEPVSSIEHLSGYKIQIRKLTSGASGKNVHYCLDMDLSYSKHKFIEFYYDCFGRDDGYTIKPEDQYLIVINSLPEEFEPDSSLRIDISIPDCTDSRMKNQTSCRPTPKPESNIDELFCLNKSVKYTYRVPETCGPTSQVLLCQTSSYTTVCEEDIDILSDLPLYGVLYNITLPESSNPSENYSLSVWGIGCRAESSNAAFTFARCSKTTIPSGPSTTLIVSLSVIACVLTASFLGAIAYWRYRSHLPPTKVDVVSKVMVVHADENSVYEERPVAFSKVLMEDLGIDVTLDLFETEAVANSTSAWIDNALCHADKVIIVWSENAIRKWEIHVENDLCEVNDLFIPTVGKIKTNGTLVDKCLAVCFEGEKNIIDSSCFFVDREKVFILPADMPQLCTFLGRDVTLDTLTQSETWTYLCNGFAPA